MSSCVNSQLLDLDTDYVCLDFAIYSPATESLGDRFSSDVGCFAESRGIPCLDLGPQWCSLAICDGWNPKDSARLRAASVMISGDAANPPFARSRLMVSWSQYPWGVRARKRGGSSGKTVSSAVVTVSANSLSSILS